MDHPFRRDLQKFGQSELNPPPEARTHAGFVKDALDMKTYRGYKTHAPYKRTGVKELSPLAAYPMFDIVWDILMDVMHLWPGYVKRNLMAAMQGQRTPAACKPRKKYTPAENKQLAEDHEAVLQDLKDWTVTDDVGKKMDERSLALAGDPKWVRSNVEVFSKSNVLTAHDWISL
jgi:hypothetical protein